MGSDKNGDQPNQWLPDEVLPGFRTFMTRFYWDCFSVASDIMRALAVGIGLEDEDHLLKKHSGHNNQLRLLHYPNVTAEALERQTVSRMPAHCDWSSITILFQDDCGGLEVEDPSQSGRFIPATPVKNAIVMNVGDMLKMWSNGYFPPPFFSCHFVPYPANQNADYLRSTNHRVTIPPLSTSFKGSDRMTPERYSIPYFIAPDPTSLIECLPTCMSEENPPKYAPITQVDYNRMRASMLY
jgi:isopenicillin N synthase-like dioxygenase